MCQDHMVCNAMIKFVKKDPGSASVLSRIMRRLLTLSDVPTWQPADETLLRRHRIYTIELNMDIAIRPLKNNL
ncbi:hypothetical protein Y1Q_0017012 [Alligator mississippiensis]|uniref:Uncharacterized protein n=1 Tax=Alligator mississippiensis TaxID=8496 RepID=A0A151MLM6_ALLMI|nr:hypothetical protein Y1Q_0017012 [Alligator mississippiensis]